MVSKLCFIQGCNREVQYICPCSSPETYSCEKHWGKHCSLLDRDHNFDSIFLKPFEGTKDAILGILVKEKSKNEKLKKKLLDSCINNLKDSESSLKENLRKLDSDSSKICDWIEKISQAQKISKLEVDPVFKLLTLQPDNAVKSVKEMIPARSYESAKLFCMLAEEIKRTIECLIKNNFEAALNKRFSTLENRLEDNDKVIDGKITEMSRCISQIIDENKRNFEDWKQEINIEKRLGEQNKILNEKLEENNNFIFHMIDEKEKNVRKNIEDLKQEINIERRFEERDKSIDEKLAGINYSISSRIEESKRNFDDREIKIKRWLKEQDKSINENFAKIKTINQKIEEINIERRLDEYNKEIKSNLADIIDENEKNRRKFEELENFILNRLEQQNKLINCKLLEMVDEIEEHIGKVQDIEKEICFETQKQFNLFGGKINSTLENFDNKINEITLLAFQDLETKKKAILSKINDKETEREFRTTCSLYKRVCSTFNQHYSQDYYEYITNYSVITSLYLTANVDDRTRLTTYDTENDIENSRFLDTPEPLDYCTCITQLPNGRLFCYGKDNPCSGIALIIDRNYRVRNLQPGAACYASSCIYFNNNVYCFGGYNKNSRLDLSRKFDLDKNRWFILTPMPQADRRCHLVIFNGNILISGIENRHILKYSVDGNAFSTIPYKFAGNQRKILINLERLYLIECNGGMIYESEDEYMWNRICNSIIMDNPHQVYWTYNKGGIYISTEQSTRYFKFDLIQKVLIPWQ